MRQEAIYDFIKEFRQKHGYSPTLEEIRVAFQMSSVSNVDYHIRKLIDAGRLTHLPGSARTLVPNETRS